MVDAAAKVLEHEQAGAAQGEVGEPSPPRTARGVAEHDRERGGLGQAEQGQHVRAQPGCDGIRIIRQHQQGGGGPGVRRVDAGSGHDRPGHRLDDPGRSTLGPALGDDAHGAGRHGILLRAAPGQAQRLRRHLARDDEAVTGTEGDPVVRQGVDDEAGDIGPGHDLPDAPNPEHRHRRHR